MTNTEKPKWSLPYETTLPTEPTSRKRAIIIRVVCYALFAVAMITPAIQLQVKTIKNHNKALAYAQRKAAGTPTAKDLLKGPPKKHKGAVNRWRPAVRNFWAGHNIYLTSEQYSRRVAEGGKAQPTGQVIVKHPNTPFTVILLTPFAYLPVWAGGLAFTILKILVALAAGLMAVRVANHQNLRMPDWVVGLGVAWWVTLIISDIQHANTNGFVLGAIVLHLWLFRRGKNFAAGAALAVAICIKMTPALFVLYWLYQRNWKLLVGCVAAGLIFAVVIPAAMVGPTHYADLTDAWLNNLIFKGLGGAWYPIHVNQSWSATVSRFLMDDQHGGNIYWNPDDNPYHQQTKFHWIAFANISPEVVKRIIQTGQFIIVAMMAWAIGWRKLPRDDGRRALHYAMIISAILILNQRTWDHHAATMLPAYLAIWYAIAFGRISRGARIAALCMILLSALLLWGGAGDLLVTIGLAGGMDKPAAKDFADIATAYSPKFFSFLLTFATAVLLSLKMKPADQPYATIRQTLTAKAD
ncbi:MAG: DUF2029 domain-containing protein [Phycisphaerae bacterium]|nr:DUF2029 domain-containing protein [Phycisphaerae bacterium]